MRSSTPEAISTTIRKLDAIHCAQCGGWREIVEWSARALGNPNLSCCEMMRMLSESSSFMQGYIEWLKQQTPRWVQ